eukprot:SAG31_NODE_9673_length_1243_cov_1.499126_1_plen_250_part_00
MEADSPGTIRTNSLQQERHDMVAAAIIDATSSNDPQVPTMVLERVTSYVDANESAAQATAEVLLPLFQLEQSAVVQAKALMIVDHCCKSAAGFAAVLKAHAPTVAAVEKLAAPGDLLNKGATPEVQQQAARIHSDFLGPNSPRAGAAVGAKAAGFGKMLKAAAGKTGELLSGEYAAKQRAERRVELEPEARKLFAEVDADQSGLLDAEEMAALATKMGIDLSPEQLAQVMATIDSDNSGQVDFDEFFEW